MLGGFSSAIDKIVSEYGGYSYDSVLDEPVRRIRLMVANIDVRVRARQKREEDIIDAQTRMLAQFIAATVKVPKGKKNTLMEDAKNLTLFKKQENSDPDNRAEDVTGANNPEVFVEQGSQTASNKEGSFEALTRGLV